MSVVAASKHGELGAGARAVASRGVLPMLSVVAFCIFMHLLAYATWYFVARGTPLESLLFDEDQLVENVSACLFAATAVGALWLCWRSRLSHRQDRLLLALVGLVAAVGFLDEISFGVRVFELPTTEVLGIRIDGVHDVVEVANTLRRDVLGPMSTAQKLAVIVGGGLVAAMAGWFIVARLLAHRGPTPRWRSATFFALGALFLLEFLVSTLVDIHTLRLPGAFAIEEMAELNAVVILMALVAVLASPTDRRELAID